MSGPGVLSDERVVFRGRGTIVQFTFFRFN